MSANSNINYNTSSNNNLINNTIKSITLDKIKGMIIGAATGDALGAPSEFKYNLKDMPYTGWIQYKPRLHIRYQGFNYASIGQITDDTEMSLSLLRQILADQTYNSENIIEAYLDWAYYTHYTYNKTGQSVTKKTRPFGMGINTRSLLGSIKQIKTYINRYKKKFGISPWLKLNEAQQYKGIRDQSKAVKDNQANGSLMRMYPLSLLPDNIRESATIIDCQLTNPSVVNLDCSLFAVRVLRRLLVGDSKVKALTFATKQGYHSSEMIKTVNSALQKEVRDITSGGWVLHSIYIAIRALIEFDRYDLAIDWIVKQEGDTDTNASIAGAWLGANIGYNNMLKEGEDYKIKDKTIKRNQYNFDQVTNCDTLDADYPRPPKYRLNDFEQLSQATYNFANLNR